MTSVAFGTTTTNLVSYDTPVLGTPVPSKVSPQGGDIVTVTVTNMGPKWLTSDYLEPPLETDDVPSEPYADIAVTMWVHGDLMALPFWVSADETQSTAAAVSFRMPPTCGTCLHAVVTSLHDVMHPLW